MDINMKKFLIAGGNITLLVRNCANGQRDTIIKQQLGNVEQVGFIKNNRLTMMGNELCINAMIAFAYELTGKGILYASGVNGEVFYSNEESKTNIKMSLSIIRLDNVILFSGIGYLCTNKNIKISREFLYGLAKNYKLPAFGIAKYINNILIPYVYVLKTNSLFQETSCGSGSIATSIYWNTREVIQPTGQIISVKRIGEVVTISAQVKRIIN